MARHVEQSLQLEYLQLPFEKILHYFLAVLYGTVPATHMVIPPYLTEPKSRIS